MSTTPSTNPTYRIQKLTYSYGIKYKAQYYSIVTIMGVPLFQWDDIGLLTSVETEAHNDISNHIRRNEAPTEEIIHEQ